VLLQPALGQDGVHPNLPRAEIDDIIELLNIELDCKYLHIDLTLIPIIATNRYALIPIVGINIVEKEKSDRHAT